MIKFFVLSENSKIELINNILSGKKDKAKDVLLSEYSDSLIRYFVQNCKFENELKKHLFLRIAIKEFTELPKKTLNQLKTTEQITSKLKEISDSLYKRFVNGKNVFTEVDALFGILPEIKNKVRQKLLNKPFGKELLETQVHNITEKEEISNEIGVNWYLLALKDLTFAEERNLTGSKAGKEKLIRCHDIILLRNIYGNSHKEIAAGLKDIYGVKSESAYRTHLSECMRKLIFLALKLKNDADKKILKKIKDNRRE